MKNIHGKIVVAFALLIALLFACGCSGGSRKTAFQVAFCSLYINESAVTEYSAAAAKNIPELTIDGTAPVFTTMIMGEAENNIESGVLNDPMMGMAGMMKMAAVASTGDLDIFIGDMDNGARQARGGMFLALSDVYSAAELSSFGDKLLSFDILKVDAYNSTPTGEKTPVCGINITGNAQMTKIFGSQEIGVFIMASTKHKDIARKLIGSLL